MKRKPDKRIVSKREYVQVQGRKLWFWAKVVGMSVAGVSLFLLIINGLHRMSPTRGVLALILLAAVGFAWWYVGKTAENTRVDVPLTRANTGDLPAPDSLVRASHELLQAQQSVLLCAAMETTQTQEEQLLRASSRLGEQ